MNTVVWRFLKSALPLGLFAALLAAVVLSGWIVSAGAPGWVRMAGIEIQAACRDAGTQWMVVVCLASYCVTFLFLQRRLFQPQKNTKNANGETVPPPSDFRPPSSITAFLAFFRGNVSNPDFWLVGFVGLVLLRYAFAYETAARSLQPLVLLTGIVLGKGIVLWGAWKPGLKAEGPGLKLEGDDSSGCGTFAPSAAEKGAEAQGVSAPSSIHHQLSTFNRSQVILSILVFLLAVSALWQPEYGMEFQYRGQRRWTGPWDNPNIYGIMMGVGAVLAVGLLVQVASFKFQVSSLGTERVRDAASVGGASVLASRLASSLASPEVSGVHGVTRPTSQRSCVWCVSWLRTRRFLIFTFLISAFVLCGFGLLKSYSRGAWLGTGVAMAWLVRSWVWRIGDAECGTNCESRKQKAKNSCFAWFKTNWFLLSVFLLSALVLCFWQFRHTENPLARRLFSVGNPNDFSWRNRVSTWAGAITMMKDRPLVGFGWGKSEEVFREQYKPARLEDAAAIQMNDYLMLGISAGTPALLCFVAYIWLSFCRLPGERRSSAEPQTSDLRLQTSAVGFAGAAVLLIGFWFDGGLFKLATGAVFWVLIELSRGSSRGNEVPTSRALVRPVRDSSRRLLPGNKWQKGLRWLAGILAGLAIGQTALHLATPRLAISARTLAIARKFLVPPREKKDFEFLATQPIWSDKLLGTLLGHVELANYNRELVNWKLADDVYRRFVLSPQIDPALDGDMSWRRPLWESFYPRIRKENNPEAAAAIVVRLLAERVTLRAGDEFPDSIAAIWQRQSTNEKGFAAIYIAALRSAGVPARTSASGQTEFWNGAEWKAAPRPPA